MGEQSFQQILEAQLEADSPQKNPTRKAPSLYINETSPFYSAYDDWKSPSIDGPVAPMSFWGRARYGVRAKENPEKIKIDWADDLLGAKIFFNHYGKIPVSEKSSLRTVKKAYHKLLFQFHPDHLGSETAEFHDLQKAYKTLVQHIK